jgi:phage anti-repressor protein
MEKEINNGINLKDFLKKYTAISNKFINEYYKFYEMCEKNKYGIDLEEVIKYLEIKNSARFYENIRKNFIENIDYIKHSIENEKKEEGKKYIKSYVNLDEFEKICMISTAKKANSVRDYFLILRKFIYYYKNNISDMIINKSLNYPDGNIYIVLANKNKNIFKFGRSKDIRKRLKNYATGKDSHPDIKFIMLVNNRADVENCVKRIVKEYQFKPNQEIYKIELDIIKKYIFDCASIHSNNIKLYNNSNVDSYIIFDDSKINIQDYNKKTSKKKSKKANKKNSKKGSKKNSKKGSKKNSKKGSKKGNKKNSKKGSKKE